MVVKLHGEQGLNSEILDQIDRLQISNRMMKLKEKYINETLKVDVERLKLLMESYKETEGEDVELRRAKGVKKVLEGMTLVIHPDELTAGSQTKYFRGACPPIEWDTEFLRQPGVYDKAEGGSITFGSPMLRACINEADLKVCDDAIAYFRGKTPAEAVRNTMKQLWGPWYEDAMQSAAIAPRYENFGPAIGVIPQMKRVLNEGLRSIMEEAEAKIRTVAEMDETDPEKLYFWQSVVIVCQGVINFARRHAQLARQMAVKEEDPVRRQELEDIASACDRVPENPARTLHEATQSVRLVALAMELEHGYVGPNLGRVDQYLYPFFKRDLDEGRLTLERAADLIGDLITFVARGERIVEIGLKEVAQSTQITHITLGGVNRKGEQACNELTYLFIHIQGLLRYPEPHSTLRLTAQTPRRILMKGLDSNSRVAGVPMYVNDDHIVNRLNKWGVALEEARDYAFNGCSQPMANPRGYTNPMHLNVPLALDLALHNGTSPISGKHIGCETGDPRKFKTFQETYQAFQKQFEFVYRKLLRAKRLMVHLQAEYWRMPLISALESDCVKNGKDFLRGGNGTYNLDYNKDRGIVDTADSLMAIKTLVFDTKKLTMEELLKALDSNFAGDRGAEIRQMCLAAPKYGNDIDEVDCLLRDMAKFTASVITSEKNAFGQPYTVNRNGLAWHYKSGKAVGALPNGRKAKEPLYDGSLSPMAGVDRKGPTALLNSAVKADYKECALGILNLKFPQSLLKNPGAADKIALMGETFFQNGGTHVQFNFLDRKVLLEAKKHPEKYRDLVVRVAGYSAFFINLTPEVQDEIIARTEQWV